MKRYLYFNASATDESDVTCVPVSQVVGMDIDANNTIEIYFNDLGNGDTNDGRVTLAINTAKTKEVADAIVQAMNFSTDPFIVVGDDLNSEYIHPDLTAVTSIDENA